MIELIIDMIIITYVIGVLCATYGEILGNINRLYKSNATSKQAMLFVLYTTWHTRTSWFYIIKQMKRQID